MGSRYGGLKQVDPIGPSGEMIVDYSVYDALRAGFGRVVFVIRRDIESDFRHVVGRRLEDRIGTHYAFQDLDALPDGYAVPTERVKPWGTAHAVLCARDAVPGSFAAINADDFYGRKAFAAIGRHLRGPESAREQGGASAGSAGSTGNDVPEYAMAGYFLRNTLSEHGHVSRGVCEVSEDGFLNGIVERETIRAFPEGIKYESPGGTWIPIPGGSVVSMNIWGFDRGFFARLDEAFRLFLETRIGEPGAECYLPAVVNGLIEKGSARVRILPTDERWFGITYREDAATAAKAVRDLIARGAYPDRLWS